MINPWISIQGMSGSKIKFKAYANKVYLRNKQGGEFLKWVKGLKLEGFSEETLKELTEKSK